MSGRKVEMLWDCKYCDHTGILGRHRTCPNCGKTRGDTVKFYLPDNPESKVLSKEESDKISNKADWYCDYCDALNKAEDSICHACGSARSESKKDYFDLRKDDEIREQKKDAQLREAQRAIESVECFLKDDANHKRNKLSSNDYDDNDEVEKTINSSGQNNGLFKKIIFGLVALLAVFGVVCLFKPTTNDVSVIDKSWERNISIEESKWVEESGWTLPGDAKLLHSAREIKTYEKVFDHYETKTVQKSRQVQDGYDVSYTYKDLGNGYAEQVEHKTPRYKTEYYTETEEVPVYRDEPVYATKYYYEIERWFKVRSVDTNGKDDEPYWGKVILGDKEREGHKMEDYDITVVIKDKEKEFDLDLSEWEQIEINDEIKIKTNLFGMCEIVEFDE